MISVEHVTVRYGPRVVLRDISFTTSNGEILVVIGPNGAGKTTLVKLINGAVPVSHGSISVEGRPISTLSRRDVAKRIAVVAQENETKFPIAVRDFVLAGRFANSSAFGWESIADAQAAQRAMSECELDGFENRMMNELSGGERQRVVLARALATGAMHLLLDEPTANLDLAHQASMFRLVRDKCKSEGYAAIVVTHDINLAAEFADQMMILDGGGIRAIGRPDEVLQAGGLREVFGVDMLLDLSPASGKVRVTTIY